MTGAAGTKLTPERAERIVNALKGGNYLETAARYGGISGSTLERWLARGRAEADRLEDPANEPIPEEAPFLELAQAVEDARAAAEVRALTRIQQAADNGTWQAAAWFLERSYPRKWGRRDRIEHSSGPEGPVKLSVTTDELEALVGKVLDGDKGTKG